MVKLEGQDKKEFEKAKDLLEGGPDTELGFVKSLYFGRLELDQVMPFPKQDPEEKARTDELIERVDEFMRNHVDPDEIDAAQRIPQHVLDGLADLGVLGMTVPREYGGGGFSHTAYCRVLQRIAETCSSTAVLIGAHQSIGLKALLLNGTEEQRNRWLPELASGRMIAAFCLSEPEVGSDAANVQTRARLSDDGTEWIINGGKKYSTNGAFAGFMTVLARTPVEDDNGQTKDKITAFIVTPDMPGFSVVYRDRPKCGIRGTWQATLEFNELRVPRENVLGTIGGGLRVALTVLNYGRCTLSAGCIGGAQVALGKAVAHARKRQQFGRSIGEFHLIKEKIARMAERLFAMESLTYLSAGLVDQHDRDVMLEAAITKLYCSEAGWTILDDALQIWGGEGYMRANGLERMFRDGRINRIVEGTTEVMTSFIALMGMRGVGEEFEQVLKAARNPVSNFGRLSRFARHGWNDILIGHKSNSALNALPDELADEGRTLAQLTRDFARRVGRLLTVHREKIINLQLPQQRIAWAAVELYATAAVISRLKMMLDDAEGRPRSDTLQRDLLIGKGFCHHAADRIRRRLDELSENRDDEVIAVADAVLGWDASKNTNGSDKPGPASKTEAKPYKPTEKTSPTKPTQGAAESPSTGG